MLNFTIEHRCRKRLPVRTVIVLPKAEARQPKIIVGFRKRFYSRIAVAPKKVRYSVTDILGP